ncbi:19984_t:CDS:1, partial [Cetraspora pellucida]
FKDTINNNKIEQSAMISISQFDISNHKVDVQSNYNAQTKLNTISLLCI